VIGVTELAAFMNRAGRLGRGMAWDHARKAELFEQTLHAQCILRDVRIDLAVGPFEPGVCNDARPPMAGTNDVDNVKIARFDDPV
jgi:hypothetical protein